MLHISRRTAGLSALAVLVTFLSANLADAQVKLQWKFKKGEKLNYAMVQNMDMNAATGKMKMKQMMDMSWQVKDVKSDGSAVLTQKITRIRMTMDNPLAGKIEYDSDKKAGGGNPVTDQLEKTMGALVNADFTITMTPYGEVKDMQLSEKAEAALKKMAGAGGGFGGGISKDTLKQMVGQVGAVFPKEAVSKGKTWNHTLESDLPFGKIKNATKLKYAGTESISGRQLARIETNASFTMTPKAGFPGKLTIKDKGSKGKMYFDVAKGRLVNSEITQNMEIQIAVGGQNVTMAMKSVIEMKLKK